MLAILSKNKTARFTYSDRAHLFSEFNMFTFTFTFMHLADAFIQSDLHCIQAIHFISMCVPWESNPQPFALLTQCSTTEPQEHVNLENMLTWSGERRD